MGIPARGVAAGGAALADPMLVADLRAAGHAVETFPYGRWRDREGMGSKVLHQLSDLVRYPRTLRSSRADIVHLNSSFDAKAILRDVPFALITRALHKPIFLKWHGSEPEYLTSRSWLWRFLVHTLLRSVDAIGVLSAEEFGSVAKRSDAPRCFIIANGLDIDSFQRVVDLRTRLGLQPTAKVLLFIGRLIPAKGLLDSVRAMSLLPTSLDAHLAVVGEGPDRIPAERLAEELRVKARVHFAGWVPEAEAAEYYCGSDVLVFPTYHPEGFPMTVFQSLAAGLGIVTTRVRAMADYLEDQTNAIFVPPRDSNALAAALSELLEDIPRLRAMQASNRVLAARFERRTVARQMATIYSDVLGAAGDGTTRHDGEDA